jgi:hypothetical protein
MSSHNDIKSSIDQAWLEIDTLRSALADFTEPQFVKKYQDLRAAEALLRRAECNEGDLVDVHEKIDAVRQAINERRASLAVGLVFWSIVTMVIAACLAIYYGMWSRQDAMLIGFKVTLHPLAVNQITTPLSLSQWAFFRCILLVACGSVFGSGINLGWILYGAVPNGMLQVSRVPFNRAAPFYVNARPDQGRARRWFERTHTYPRGDRRRWWVAGIQ